MRVRRLDLVAYGHYEDATIDLSANPPGLTVLCGPNEAGKSTARSALLAVMFGFQRDDSGAHRYGRHGMRVGATISAADGRTLEFIREGQSRILDASGADLAAEVIDQFLDGIDRASYLRLFSIAHDDLRAGSEELLRSDGEIGRLVYGASLGSGSVAAVLQRLEQREDRLFHARGRAQLIPKALEAHRKGLRDARRERLRSRDWERLQQEVAAAQRDLEEIRSRFTRSGTNLSRLERIRAARPLLARRADAAQRYEELGAVPPPEWAERSRASLRAFRECRYTLEGAAGVRQRRASELDLAVRPGPALECAAAIARLVEGIGRYRKDTADLPKRRAELEAQCEEVGKQLQALGITEDDGRVVAEHHLARVEWLSRRHVELTAAGRTIEQEADAARERVTSAKESLANLPESRSLEELGRALRLAEAKLDAAEEVILGRAEQQKVMTDLDAAAGRLGLTAVSRSRIEAMAVPADAEVDNERTRREAVRLQLRQISDEDAAVGAQLTSVRIEINSVSGAVPDPERLPTTRLRRDKGWQLIRGRLAGAPTVMEEAAWARTMPLEEAFERAVTDADEAADDRYEHADGLAQLAQLNQRVQELEHKLHELAERKQRILTEDAEGKARWERLWEAAGVGAAAPEAMAAWLRDYRTLVADYGTWRSRSSEIDGLADTVQGTRTYLARVLRESGSEPCSDALDALVSQAQELVAEGRALEQRRHDAVSELRSGEKAARQRSETLESHWRLLADWDRDWQAALSPLAPPELIQPEVASSVTSAHRELPRARSAVTKLERRIDGIEADRRAFADEVRAVASSLITQNSDADPVDIVSLLQGELESAHRAHERCRALEAALEEAQTEEADAEEAYLEAARSLRAMRSEGGLNDSNDLEQGVDDAIRASLEAGTQMERRQEAERDLLEQGGGFSIEELAEQSRSVGDSLDSSIEAAEGEVDLLRGRLEQANRRLSDAERAAGIIEITRAADLEQDAEGELALAASLASEYARTALAAEVLRQTISAYGERHRGPLLGRASELFSRLTHNAFPQLVVDSHDARRVLLARRRNGEMCGTAALSDGARDQLYLALRLAAIEYQLSQLEDAPPIVLDDILVHFDDDRAAAAVGILGELGQTAQVLLLTHHKRIVEVAEHEISADRLSIVRLAERDHDLRPISSHVEASSGDDAGTRDRTGDAEQRILKAARSAAGRGLAKSELLELSGVPESQWQTSIRSLVDRHVLVQEGNKRGARYRVP